MAYVLNSTGVTHPAKCLCSTLGMFSAPGDTGDVHYTRGYHDECGGYHDEFGGIMMSLGDIMMTVGDIMSTPARY